MRVPIVFAVLSLICSIFVAVQLTLMPILGILFALGGLVALVKRKSLLKHEFYFPFVLNLLGLYMSAVLVLYFVFDSTY